MIPGNDEKSVSERNGAEEFDPFALEPEKQDRRPGGGIAWLALVLALAVAGFNGYQWWLDGQAVDARAGEQAQLDALGRQQAELDRALQELRERLGRLEQDDSAEALDGLGQAVAELRRQMADLDSQSVGAEAREQSLQAALFDLQQGLAGLETTVAAQAAREEPPGQRLDLYEVESLLRMASERLQLFGDPRAADQALVLADERLAGMDDPVYLPVRQRISRARQALASIELPDLVLLEGRINALQAAIASLPFTGGSAPPPAERPPAEGIWARLKQTLAGLVTVRRRVPDEPAVLSLDDKDYLRQGLWLQLESARLSLMRRDAEVYQRSLERARATLTDHFEGNTASTQRFAAELEALRDAGIAVEMPDISAPWGQLRLQRERAGMVAPPVAPEPAARVAEPLPADGGQGDAPATGQDSAGDAAEAVAEPADSGAGEG